MTFVGETAPARLGRVRWRRFAIILVPATALVVMLLMLTSQSVLAVSVSISGQPFDVTAKLLKGQGFEQFGVVEHSATNDLPGHSNQIVLAATAMRSATINLVVFADRFSGNASFKHLTLGRDASTLNEVPGIRGPSGGFSMHAKTVTISNLKQHAFATTAGTFTLPGFRLRFGGGC